MGWEIGAFKTGPLDPSELVPTKNSILVVPVEFERR
jgi:hypothetical protein